MFWSKSSNKWKIIDHLSDINLPLSEHARIILYPGIKPETIIKIGSPMKEVIDVNMNLMNQAIFLLIIN